MNATQICKTTGDFVINVNAQCEAILSPDKTQKLIPCDHCLKLEWRRLNVVSFLCEDCYYKLSHGGLDDIDMSFLKDADKFFH